jgi:hypothetical protein
MNVVPHNPHFICLLLVPLEPQLLPLQRQNTLHVLQLHAVSPKSCTAHNCAMLLLLQLLLLQCSM